jgi:hypothetical protein
VAVAVEHRGDSSPIDIDADHGEVGALLLSAARESVAAGYGFCLKAIGGARDVAHQPLSRATAAEVVNVGDHRRATRSVDGTDRTLL